MNTDPPGYLTEDLQLREVSGPPSYRGITSGPVQYIAIANQSGVVIAYIYANDEDDVAGWQARPDVGHEAHSGYYPWMIKLRACKARGLPPSAALDELVRDEVDTPQDPRSHVVPGPRRHADSLEALRDHPATSNSVRS
ncbi:hypothetical protein J5X84_25830 [Streptosporangiaceae bacterium NEAU-GS5]|nr:hypothetical protein [Streptosporangiaceae bacterium NEAU-GS5]